MAREERSAGVVLVRETADGPPLFLLLDYGKYWDYAKGHVEKGEDDLATARRELLEETGIREVSFVGGFRREMVYFFRSRRGLVRKTVIFFLAKTRVQDVLLSDEHVDFIWLDGPAALGRLTYAGARQVLQVAIEHLRLNR